MPVVAKGALFPESVEKKIFNLVKGHSSLAKLCGQEPVPFTGKDIFTFSMDTDVSIVGENAAKGANGAAFAVVKMAPVKVVYQSRVSNEFMYASEEEQLNVLEAFADGFAKKLARGLDKMALHGINPATGSASGIIGTNNFDSKCTTNAISYSQIDTNIDDAVTAVEAHDYVANGILMAPAARSEISSLKGTNGEKLYPEFNFGAVPANLGAMALDVNSTVTADKAVVGDFTAFRWGIAKQLPIEVIEYGDPDNTGVDLKGNNQVCIRSEAFIGWAIMDEKAFSVIA